METTWAVSGTPVITANSTVSPDGNTTADTVQDDDGAGYEYIVQTIAGISNSVTHTTSVFVLKDAVAKATRFPAFTLRYKTGGTTSDLRFGFDTSTGEVGTAVQSGTCTITGSGVIDAGDYWRFWVATTNDATGNTELEMRYYPAFGAGAGLTTASAAATGSNVVFGFQFELGSFPTSYIKTTTASVTRAADVATDTSIPWYNQSEGTVILEGSGPSDTTSTLYATFYESSSDYVSVQRNTTAARGQSNGVSIQGGTWATNIIGKVAIGYKLNDYAVAFDGALLGTDASGTPPTAATELRLSSTQTGTQKNGTISRIRYYAKRLPNTKLQALTGS